MFELERQIERYLLELQRQNASVHTVRNYGSDLRQFLRSEEHTSELQSH